MSTDNSAWENPNKYMSRAVREVFSVAVAPVAGQSRDFQFICRGDEQFDAVADNLKEALVDTGILNEGDYTVNKTVTTPAKDGNLSYITGELTLQVQPHKYSSDDVHARVMKALDYVSQKSTPSALSHHNDDDLDLPVAANG